MINEPQIQRIEITDKERHPFWCNISKIEEALPTMHRDDAAWLVQEAKALAELHGMNLEEVKRLSDRLRIFEMRDDRDLADAAAGAIREVLEANGVPVAAFIEDHVRNLVVQRNEAMKALSEIATRVLDHRDAMRIARAALDSINTRFI
jgi:hypothetical protein